jgi:SET domain-containing protein
MPVQETPAAVPEVMMIRVGSSKGKGRGVFARRQIAEGELIEQAPVLVIPSRQWRYAEQTVLYDYCFSWGADHEHAALALGFGSLYNHSYQPNAAYIKRLSEQLIDFIALRTIAQGEEITINYNGPSEGRAPMWFGEVVE